ncbi:MBOAT family protein [Christensenellaceae bacterium OttesenSCG-928-K19]|nr:MBOAT family protein [Christensenellaceae bacterium OttesenSCG-928-K19]
MLFSSLIFLWIFLPIVFVLYRIIKNPVARNIILLIASLFFYAWGEPIYIVLMLGSITINYVFGRLIDSAKKQSGRKWFLILCVIINLGLLGYFKYFNFFFDIFGALSGVATINMTTVILPIGISFYTFQAMSYIIDLYRKKINVQKSYYKLALYISFFPQLIAGPIVRYQDIEAQIDKRTLTKEKTAYGIKRFIYGLSKKVLIANTMALIADRIYALDMGQLSSGLIWIAAISYMLQIYFDFSGYSDMAIGLGKMFGFDFLENFNYPYTSTSIKDFWRRWHISLSTWFKEYLYIPLGGNRKGRFRTYLNLLIVFFATGLWHGASWNFVVWGLYNGCFLIIERLFLGKLLDKCKFKFINIVYSLIVVIVGWVIFRVEDLGKAFELIRRMFVVGQESIVLNIWQFIDARAITFTVAGIILCGIIQQNKKLKHALYNEKRAYGIEIPILVVLLLYCFITLVSGTYNPFIYFRF